MPQEPSVSADHAVPCTVGTITLGVVEPSGSRMQLWCIQAANLVVSTLNWVPLDRLIVMPVVDVMMGMCENDVHAEWSANSHLSVCACSLMSRMWSLVMTSLSIGTNLQ